jgi:hypothetical protein
MNPFQDTNIYLILQLMPLPEDIKYKILILLLGISKTPTANRILHSQFRTTSLIIKFRHVGLQYEINEPPNSLQEAILCEIRIMQFDASALMRRQQPGAIKNVQRYKQILAKRFKERYNAMYH